MTLFGFQGARARSFRQLLAHALFGLAGLAALNAQAAGLAKCKDCAFTNGGVVHAAGVPSHVSKLAKSLHFDGEYLVDGASRSISYLAETLGKGNAPSKPTTLRVTYDAQLKGEAAEAQATARAKTLTDALVKAGLPADRFVVKPVAR